MSSFKNKEAIGGYFELELNRGKEYHHNALAFNTGRNCLEYILKVRKYKKVYIPYYTCEVILEPFLKTKTPFKFYRIDENLEPLNIDLKKDEALLYTNYFGIKGATAKKLSKIYKNLIIDNSQAFFDKPLKGVDTFYSPRKFFGVPDGGYLYIDKYLINNFKIDNSFSRFEHLLKRIDVSPEAGFTNFRNINNSLKNQPIKYMSIITRKILQSINYKEIIDIRKSNFSYLHKSLKQLNRMRFIGGNTIPIQYPLLLNKNIRNRLINEKIYVPIYWQNVFRCARNIKFEIDITANLLALPIDQRYKKTELDFIIKIVRKYA